MQDGHARREHGSCYDIGLEAGLQFSGLGSRAAFESPTACFRPTTARRLDSTAASNRVTPCRACLHSGESIQGITAYSDFNRASCTQHRDTFSGHCFVSNLRMVSLLIHTLIMKLYKYTAIPPILGRWLHCQHTDLANHCRLYLAM